MLTPPPHIPTGLPPGSPAGLGKPVGIEDPLLVLQYQQYRLLQNQQMLLKQMQASATAALSQSPHWGNLTPLEKNQLVTQYVRAFEQNSGDVPQHQPTPPPHISSPVLPGGFLPQMPQTAPPTNSMMQLYPMMHEVRLKTRVFTTLKKRVTLRIISILGSKGFIRASACTISEFTYISDPTAANSYRSYPAVNAANEWNTQFTSNAANSSGTTTSTATASADTVTVSII